MTPLVMLRSDMVGVERERSPHQFEQGRMHFPNACAPTCVRPAIRSCDVTAACQNLIAPRACRELATAHLVTETQDGAGPFYRHRGLRDAIVWCENHDFRSRLPVPCS